MVTMETCPTTKFTDEFFHEKNMFLPSKCTIN